MSNSPGLLQQVLALQEELKKIQQVNKELEVMLDSSFDEIYLTDGNRVTLRVSAACERLYGVKPEELVGKPVDELVKAGLFFPSCTEVVLKEKRRVTILQHTRSGRQVVVTGNPVFNGDGVIERIVINSRDITEINVLKERLADTEALADSYRQQIARLNQISLQQAKCQMVAESPAMREVVDLARRVAKVDSTILLLGETGVGKGLLAAHIHQNSPRCRGPFISVNCAAIPASLLESELFGYETGAFTGARKEGKKGTIEMADQGTLFLDEIAELPLALQAKLLQVIQEKRVVRVGGYKERPVNVRILAATNQDIQRMVATGGFREDLYYRLNVVPITVPPLRCRREDIPFLIEVCLGRFKEKYGITKKLAPEVLDLFINYDWPGNVRELENVIERLVVTSDRKEIAVSHLPELFLSRAAGRKEPVVIVQGLCTLSRAIEELEKQLIARAYHQFGNTYRIAEVLGINQSTAVRKINKYLSVRRRKPNKNTSCSEQL
ncbi:MAG: sigma 54-interacting transcriptional regulator [Syntrophomonadaceae bacterium]|nr:sigma 54-interacting transcriptional regulator [Syntrophomonadaceae bacterium]